MQKTLIFPRLIAASGIILSLFFTYQMLKVVFGEVPVLAVVFLSAFFQLAQYYFTYTWPSHKSYINAGVVGILFLLSVAASFLTAFHFMSQEKQAGISREMAYSDEMRHKSDEMRIAEDRIKSAEAALASLEVEQRIYLEGMKGPYKTRNTKASHDLKPQLEKARASLETRRQEKERLLNEPTTGYMPKTFIETLNLTILAIIAGIVAVLIELITTMALLSSCQPPKGPKILPKLVGDNSEKPATPPKLKAVPLTPEPEFRQKIERGDFRNKQGQISQNSVVKNRPQNMSERQAIEIFKTLKAKNEEKSHVG